MKILTLTTLFPDSSRPSHAVFVENRLRHVVATGEVESRVIAPVPWFPFNSPRFGDYAKFARVPRAERRHGLEVTHPRYVLLPKVGMTLAPLAMYAAMLPAARKLIRSGFDFDMIDAHYFYPDGVAAALVAKALGKPFTVTARGTDINLIPRHALPRRMIRWVGARSDANIAVCQALKDEIVALGIPEAKTHVLRNGVDLALFKPSNREKTRAERGIAGPTLLSVGLLIQRKGHDLIIEAMRLLPEHTLLIAGAGPERQALEQAAARHGVSARVHFLGLVGHDALPALYGAADALVLASDREGWPNVLLESMACGTPVVATNIWGNPEVVRKPAAGQLIPERTPAAIAAGVKALFSAMPAREATRAYAEDFDWGPTTQGQLRLFDTIIRQHQSKAPGTSGVERRIA